MEKNREYFKNLLAINAQDVLYDELFDLFSRHKKRYQNRLIAEKYDDLVLLSGKLNSAQQCQHLGVLSVGDFNTELSRVNFALLDLLNDLPDSFFQEAGSTDAPVVSGAKKQYNIPSGISNGLFWMGALLMGMITIGSAIQGNWITFTFTLIATLICLPPSYDYCTDKFHVTISGSIRVLLIMVLTSVGLSFASTTTERQAPSHSQPNNQ